MTFTRNISGMSVPATITFDCGVEFDSTWTETHILHADLRAVNPCEIVNQVSRPEQRQQYCGEKFVNAARIIECSESRTVVEQQGGCG